MPKTKKTLKKKSPGPTSPAIRTLVANDRRVERLQEALDDSQALVAKLRAKNTVVPGYEDLASILNAALEQASLGKGRERHANDLPFNKQKMIGISDLFHGPQGMLWQAAKKATEANEMLSRDPASQPFYEKELLGAINYIAGAILFARMKVQS